MTPKDFENTVATLMRLGGYDVRGETLVGHKKVDVFAEEKRLGKRRRIAVECKLHARALTQDDLSSIYSNYRPLYDSNEIDEILVVTENGVAPSAATFAQNARGLAHLTFFELQNSVIDFSAYTFALASQVDEDGLATYYIPPKVRGAVDLYDLVLQWIEQSHQPLAILGGYGMGKTSFARFIAARLARATLAAPSARIPILIRLADISAEQSLEGLLGRVLATTGSVRNYNFDAFMELNRRGRFVIFLDGFDEMKHSLVWDQFRYNFKELNRLLAPASRVVLLGRPTAFLSDSEQQYILHGVRRDGGATFRDPSWPDYEEIELQPFTTEQVACFLERYSKYLVSAGKVPAADAAAVAARINALPPEKLADLATRPVQLRILVEVLPQWSGDLTDLTTTKLYSAFINIVIEREQEKITRRRFDLKERRAFARELAFWLWTNRTVMSIDAERIPRELFPAPKGDDLEEGVRRDMVSACFLERKIGTALFFPHRSFQEFLVAEKIVHDLRVGVFDVRRVWDAVSTEVAQFLAHLWQPDDFDRFLGFLGRSVGPVGNPLIESFVTSHECVEKLYNALYRREITRWTPVLAAAAVVSGSELLTADTYFETLRDAASRLGPQARLAALFGSLIISQNDSAVRSASSVVDLFWAMFEAAYGDWLKTSGGRSRFEQPPPVVFGHADVAEVRIVRNVQWFRTDATMHRFQFVKAYTALANELRDVVMLRDWEAGARGMAMSGRAQLEVTTVLNERSFERSDSETGVNLLDLFLRRLMRLEPRRAPRAR